MEIHRCCEARVVWWIICRLEIWPWINIFNKLFVSLGQSDFLVLYPGDHNLTFSDLPSWTIGQTLEPNWWEENLAMIRYYLCSRIKLFSLPTKNCSLENSGIKDWFEVLHVEQMGMVLFSKYISWPKGISCLMLTDCLLCTKQIYVPYIKFLFSSILPCWIQTLTLSVNHTICSILAVPFFYLWKVALTSSGLTSLST